MPARLSHMCMREKAKRKGDYQKANFAWGGRIGGK